MQNNLHTIKQLLGDRDLDSLKKLALTCKRSINKTQYYRSVLMLSAHNLEHLMKIPQLNADAVILNLEDGVSVENKPFALVLVAIFLCKYKQIEKKLIVRVNALQEGGYEEIAYLNQFCPDAIRVPKIKTVNEVKEVLDILHKDIELHLSIETSDAWLNLVSLGINTRVSAFYLGILDLFVDMGLSQSLITPQNPTTKYILSHFLITCRALHVKAVAPVFQKYKDIDTFKQWVELEKSMGYNAKACISPKQTDIVNDILKPSALHIEKAKEIIRLFEQNKSKAITGFVDERYGFIDEPIYKDALNTLRHI